MYHLEAVRGATTTTTITIRATIARRVVKLVYIFIYTIVRWWEGDFRHFAIWKENLKMKERKIPGSRRRTKDEEALLDEDLRQGESRKEISEMWRVMEEFYYFIGRGLRHLKRYSQPKSDTWHVPRRNRSTSLITNEVKTCDTSNHKHKRVHPRNDMGPHVPLDDPSTRGQLMVYYNSPTPNSSNVIVQGEEGKRGKCRWIAL